MWLPDWLYERLPLVYLAAAIWCLWALSDSFARTLSVFLLVAAAVVTYVWRHRARREEALLQARDEELKQQRQMHRT